MGAALAAVRARPLALPGRSTAPARRTPPAAHPEPELRDLAREVAAKHPRADVR